MFHGPGPGRPKGSKNKLTGDIVSIVDKLAEKNGGWEKLFERFILSEDEDVAFKATQLMLAYGFGKPRERVEVTGEDGGPVEHTIRFGGGVIGLGDAR